MHRRTSRSSSCSTGALVGTLISHPYVFFQTTARDDGIDLGVCRRELEALDVIERELRRQRLDAAVQRREEHRGDREDDGRGKRKREPPVRGDPSRGCERAARGRPTYAGRAALVELRRRLRHELVSPRVEHFPRRPFPRDPAPAARARGQMRLKPPQIPGCDLVVDVGGEQRLDLAALGHAWHHAHFVI